MLSLRFGADDYAFVYSGGRPIGAIVVGEVKGQFPLLFAGNRSDFEVLRPQAVARRFGMEELAKLESLFLTADYPGRIRRTEAIHA